MMMQTSDDAAVRDELPIRSRDDERVYLLPGDEVRLYPEPCCEGPCEHEADGTAPAGELVTILAVERHPANPTWVQGFRVRGDGREGDARERSVPAGKVAAYLYPLAVCATCGGSGESECGVFDAPCPNGPCHGHCEVPCPDCGGSEAE